MKPVRLLPVVIAATLALLVFKGVGLVTSGGYVLIGSAQAVASGDTGHGGGEAAAGGEPTLDLPHEVTMSDSSPTLDDGALTLPLGPEADVAAAGHGDAPAEAAAHGEAQEPMAESDCPEAAPAAAAAEGAHEQDNLPGFDFPVAAADCKVDPGTNAAGDALPTIKDGSGRIVPLADLDPQAGSEAAVLGRLGERRTDLDTREAELEMRMALLEAAELRLKQRTAALEALEKQINALVEEKKLAEDGQFIAIVAMYETMKPKDAAAILNELEMPVLLKVARAMSPRKMGPILARMDPVKAKNLTSGMAINEAEPVLDLAAENLDTLPQIIGQ